MEWEPFLLNPNIADEGEDILEHLSKKYGPSAMARFGNPNSHLMQAGRQVGIAFTNDRRVYPTVQAHALVEHVKATDNDKANGIMEELYKRYFEKGENINSIETLTDAAGKFGIEPDTVRTVCTDEDLQEQVRQRAVSYQRRGVSGVPFFMIEPLKGGRPIAFSGAQPVDIIAEQLELAAEE